MIRGNTVNVIGKAFDILLLLARKPGTFVSKKELMNSVWATTVVEEVSLRVQVAALRKVLSDHNNGNHCIRNVSGKGYALILSPDLFVNRPGLHIVGSEISGFLPSRDDPVVIDVQDPIVGRVADVEAIVALLAAHRFVTIVGPGGVGKTTAALSVLSTLAPKTEAKWAIVDLTSVSNSEHVAVAIAAALSIPVLRTPPLQSVISALRQRSTMLILDGCEHVLEWAVLVVEAIRHAVADIGILATSREPLRARGEWIYRLDPLAQPESDMDLTARSALEYPAVELFVERARSAMNDFVFRDVDVAMVCRLCRALDGLPLAIELAAARITFFGISGLYASLESRFTLLSGGQRSALPHHKTMRATLDWSYDTLSDVEKTTLRRLSIFKGSFDVAGAIAVVSRPGFRDDLVLPSLFSLVDKSLLVSNPEGPCATLRLLDSTRRYAYEKLDEAGDLAATADAHLHFFIHLYTDVSLAADASPEDRWITVNRRVLDDIRAALDWSLGRQETFELGCRLLAASAPLWYQFSLLEEYRAKLNAAFLDLPGHSASANTVFELHLALGHADFQSCGPSEASANRHYETAIDMAREEGDPAHTLKAIYGLLVMTVMAGDYSKAADLGRQLASNQSIQQKSARIVLRLQALIDAQMGKHAASISCAHGALKASSKPKGVRFARDLISYDHESTVKSLLSRVLWQVGDIDDALNLALDSLAGAQTLNHQLSIICSLGSGICPVAAWCGDHQLLGVHLPLLRKLANELSLVNWKHHAECFEFAFPQKGAQALGQPAFPEIEQLVPPAQEFLASVDARFVTPLCVERAQSGMSGWGTAEILRVHAMRNFEQTKGWPSERVEAQLETAIGVAKKQGALSWELRAVTSLAKIAEKQKRYAFAEDRLSSVLERFTQGLTTHDLQQAYALRNALCRTG